VTYIVEHVIFPCAFRVGNVVFGTRFGLYVSCRVFYANYEKEEEQEYTWKAPQDCHRHDIRKTGKRKSPGIFAVNLLRVQPVLEYINTPPTVMPFSHQPNFPFVPKMNVTTRNGVSVYDLTAGAQLPEWLGDQAKRNLAKRDASIRRRIELLQDFEMPSSSSKIRQSRDGRYIFATGTYPPRIKCFDVHELSLKYERYLDAGVVDLQLLGDDYGKLAILREDRFVEFHAPYGKHETVRIPTFGRGLAYEPTTCELLVAAQGSRVYRIHLEEGRFSEPWELNTDNASSTCLAVHPHHPMTSVGCTDGSVRFWDHRTDRLTPFCTLNVHGSTQTYGYGESSTEITSLAHDGMHLAAGTAGGVVALYDVRSSQPLFVQEHKQGTAIHTIHFHGHHILSADEKLIKVWRYRSEESTGSEKTQELGAVHVNIEGQGKLSNFILAGDEKDSTGSTSGVILCAGDQPKMQAFYVPSIGVAPQWCSYLENITEELEERDLNRQGDGVGADEEAIYENYKFVTRDDIAKLGISSLIGTPLLRGYMHGFFIDNNLYNRVKAVANPFEYQAYRKEKLKERMDAKRQSRIAPRTKKPKTAVNADLAERLQDKAKSSTKAGKLADSMLKDDRFGSMFTNPDYDIDEEDEYFKLRNPSGVAAIKRKENNLDSDDSEEEDDGAAVDNEASLSSDHDSSSDSDSDDDGFRGAKVRGEAYQAMKELSAKRPRTASRSKKLEMIETSAEGKDALALSMGASVTENKTSKRLAELSLPLSQRLAAGKSKTSTTVRLVHGSKEATYIPKDSKSKNKDNDDEERGRKNTQRRRGVKELGFKVPFRNRK